MRTRMVLVLSAALVLSVGVAASTARADVVLQVTVPYSHVITNDCNGDAVSLTGIDHAVERVTTSGSGRVNYGLHETVDASGIGLPSGAHYDVRFEVNVSFGDAFQTGPGAFAGNFLLRNVFIIDGHVETNLNAIIEEHGTTTPNGDFVAQTLKITTKCNG